MDDHIDTFTIAKAHGFVGKDGNGVPLKIGDTVAWLSDSGENRVGRLIYNKTMLYKSWRRDSREKLVHKYGVRQLQTRKRYTPATGEPVYESYYGYTVAFSSLRSLVKVENDIQVQ